MPTMITNRLLTASDFPALYACFLEAFSDYQVDLQMSHEQFAQRLTRDGVQMEMSAAAFDDDRMIGFYVNGIGEWQGKQSAYDAGTGVIPSYRKRGIAKDLFAFLVPRLKEVSVSQYLLEVITTNTPAVALYRKVGFVETRQLAVFRSSEGIKAVEEVEGVSIREVEQPAWERFRSFWDGYPSWQNSIAAIERVKDRTVVVGAYQDERCIGYGAVFQPSGLLMQLAVESRHRRKGIGRAIMASLQRQVEGLLKTNNVDGEMRSAMAFYEALGFKEVLRQFEMVKTL